LTFPTLASAFGGRGDSSITESLLVPKPIQLGRTLGRVEPFEESALRDSSNKRKYPCNPCVSRSETRARKRFFGTDDTD
jgi:hypothetical protein